jgi:phosphoglycolate phosphatase-like HAD superfamily hydrolase
MWPQNRPPELVIFDIDGTLLATDAFWLEIGRRAVAAAYARHGVERELPDASRFLAAIGLPLPAFWEEILPADLHFLLEEVETEAEGLADAAFATGHGALYPGARALLDELARARVHLALASNCGRRYLDSFQKAFGLATVVTEARCQDSPGVGSKADMVADILAASGTRDAVMVGDRDSDRLAARANGIPFILFTGGFGGEEPRAGDYVARDYGEIRHYLLGEPSPPSFSFFTSRR